MGIIVHDGLTRAEGEFDMGSFYDTIDEIDFSSILLDISKIADFVKALADAISSLLKDLGLKGDLKDLMLKVVEDIATEYNVGLSAKERALLSNAYAVMCNGIKLDTKFNIDDLLKALLMAFVFSVTICNKDDIFKDFYESHNKDIINETKDNYDRLTTNIDTAIRTNRHVINAQNERDVAYSTLYSLDSMALDPIINSANTDMLIKARALREAEETLERAKNGDGDYLTALEAYEIALKVYEDAIVNLEQKYVDSIEVGIMDMRSTLEQAEKTLETALMLARSSDDVKRLQEEQQAYDALYKSLINSRRELFANSVTHTMRIVKNKAKPEEISLFMKSINTTDVNKSIINRDVVQSYGETLDSTLNKSEMVKTEMGNLGVVKRPSMPTFKTPPPPKSIGSILVLFTGSPEKLPDAGALYPKFDHDAVQTTIIDALGLNPLNLEEIRKYKVFRSALLQDLEYSDDASKLWQCI